jgi:hypothetical protein
VAGKLNVAGLVVAAAGIVIQIASGADYPTVPRGLIIFLAAAALVALATRWGWTSVVGVIAPAFLLVGAAIAPKTRDPSRMGVLVGTVGQLLALVVALVAGVVATRQAYPTQIRT